MSITGFVVCVGDYYVDFLKNTIEQWKHIVDKVVVVSDSKTNLPDSFSETYITDAFYEGGAKFNKGLALCRAYNSHRSNLDWVLLFDADIEPVGEVKKHIREESLDKSCVHGSRRWQAPGYSPRHKEEFRMGDCEPAGFFLLFHASHPAVSGPTPIPLQTHRQL